MNTEQSKALIVGVKVGQNPDFEQSLSELEALAKACDYEVAGVETQKVDHINTGVYVGKGKVEEIKALAHMLDVDVVIFDNSLSPMQLRNLNQIIDRAVMDRTNLILEIFSRRARTREAQIQVEMARLQYELPRLTGMGEMLSRQGGGSSGGLANKGAGEKKLELDRRKIRHRLSELRKECREIEQNRATQRKRRQRGGIPQVSLVGYTNAGKSTLMNALIDRFSSEEEPAQENKRRKVYVEDMLFATLDTTVRKITLPDKREFLLSDTVGFVSNLPHDLVEAFHSTLEEITFADLLLIVIDYADPAWEDHLLVTRETLRRLHAEEIPCLYVYNKCDLAMKQEREQMPDALPKTGHRCIYMAAGRQIGLDELVSLIENEIYQDYMECSMLIPYTEGALTAYFNENAVVNRTEYLAEGTLLHMSCPLKDVQKYKKYIMM